MKLLFFVLFTHSFAHAYLSYGNGSDDCNFSSTQTLTKAVWNCIDLNIPNGVTINFAASVTDAVQFRVQGDVTIDGIINVAASGNTAGAGGTNGATCGANSLCNASNATGAGGVGLGGLTGSDDGGTNDSYGDGGSGSGGSLNSAAANTTIGIAGANTDGTGAVGGAGGETNGFFAATSLSTTLQGGIGGGAGGSGRIFELTASSFATGGSGGGGGGAIAIIAKGSVLLDTNAQINANGAQGLAGASVTNAFGANTTVGGSGGSGSGGSIYIISETSVTSNNSNINISGGAAFTGGPGVNGGLGGDGIFKVDSPVGTFTGSFTPAPVTGTTPSNILDPGIGGGLTISSEISPTCAYKEMPEFEYTNLGLSFLIGFCLISFFSLVSSKLTPDLRHI